MGLGIQPPHYYNFITAKRYEAKSSKRERSWGKIQRVQSTRTQESSLSEVTQVCFFPLSPLVTIPCEMFSTGEVFLSLGLQGFTGGWTCKLHLPRLCRNSRLPAGKQLLSIIHVVCTKNFATVKPLFQVNGVNLVKIQVPRYKDRPQLASRAS